MTGAMYAAIGGLKAHMTKLNVIGNNVANVNTYGYKSQRMVFRESIYTTSRSGSNGGVTLGGNTPSQIGYGCSVGSIDLNMAPSTYAPTGYNLDCMMTGEGFFLVGDKIDYEITKTYDADGNYVSREVVGHGIQSAEELTTPFLTRVGDFFVDPDGYICNGDNKVVYGFARVQNPYYNPDATTEDIKKARAEGKDIENPTIISTELVPLRIPLSAAAPTEENGGKVPRLDENGDPMFELDENGDPDEDKPLYDFLWEEGDPVYPYLHSNIEGENRYPGYEEKAAPYDHTNGTFNKTQIAVAQNTNVNRVSDEMVAYVESMQIGTDGAITGIVNGQTIVVGYVGIVSPDTPNGVTHMDGPYYKAMGGAGNLRVFCLAGQLPTKYLGNQTVTQDEDDNDVVPKAADAILNSTTNSIKNGGLEASSTDVATEFAEMITTQRGYQANTRIVTVTDSMLEELVNMKR